jgi:hypothetical protein
VSSSGDVSGAIDAGATWIIVGSEISALTSFWKNASHAKNL